MNYALFGLGMITGVLILLAIQITIERIKAAIVREMQEAIKPTKNVTDRK
jgi:hypothetical protein